MSIQIKIKKITFPFSPQSPRQFAVDADPLVLTGGHDDIQAKGHGWRCSQLTERMKGTRKMKQRDAGEKSRCRKEEETETVDVHS